MPASPHILICDDDPVVHESLGLYFENEHFTYSSAYDGKEALVHAVSDRPDLIILDLMMPEKTGIEVCRELRKTMSTPIIILTAKGEEIDRVLGLELGADDYIVKPFDVMTLLVRIEKVLNRAGKLDQILRFSNITIDLQEHTVRRDEAEILLKPMEFEVLVLLVRHKNRTIPRDKMLNEIWGTDFFGDTRTVDVHIANIRKKLGVDGLIKTIPKYGYRLEG